MKKKFFTTAFAVSLLSGVGYGICAKSANCSDKELNSLVLVNIEALSYTEWGHDSACDGPGPGCILPNSEWYHDLKGDYPD